MGMERVGGKGRQSASRVVIFCWVHCVPSVVGCGVFDPYSENEEARRE